MARPSPYEAQRNDKAFPGPGGVADTAYKKHPRWLSPALPQPGLEPEDCSPAETAPTDIS